MNNGLKFAGFLAAVLAVFGIALTVGNAVGPIDSEPAAHNAAHSDPDTPKDSHNGHGADTDPAPTTQPEIPGGLMTSQDGYTLVLAEDRARAGENRTVLFTIAGPDGDPITEYEVEHEKQLHLIAVRRDFTGFQHVHPALDEKSGVWSTDLDLTPGTWRIFTDFKATGAEALTLGADLAVDGVHQAGGPVAENRTATVGDYEVTLEGDLTAGTDAELTVSVSKDGKPVTDLEPYLGAYGHLVALRGGDLAYLHVHPDGTPGDGSTEPGPEVTFYAAVPSEGVYHLYLDFQHDGVVRTAAFTVTAGGTGSTESDTGSGTESGTPSDNTSAEHGEHSGH